VAHNIVDSGDLFNAIFPISELVTIHTSEHKEDFFGQEIGPDARL
jgi:hypothetical protein